MGFRFGSGDRVQTANGKSGEVKFRDKGQNGGQDRYAILEDDSRDGQARVYFDEEVRRES